MQVLVRSPVASRGILRLGGLRLPVALGKGGLRALKREGDGATPRGVWPLRQVLYRADRRFPPRTRLPVRPIARDEGWCDDPADRNYNRRVQHPYPASAEHLIRSDALYDVVVVLACNERPRLRGRGSAIFLHLARAGYAPTEGCLALSRRDLDLVLSRLGPRAAVRIGA